MVTLPRRRLLSLMISALVVVGARALAPVTAFAQDAKTDPGKFISQFAQTAIVDVLQAKISTQDKAQRFRTLFKEFFDIPAIARFVLGRFWKAAQPEQQEQFLKSFEDVIVYTWSRRFSEYEGQTLRVDSTAPDGDNGSVVNAAIVGKNNQNVAVAWRLRKRDEGFKIVDVIVEGVSMAITYRQEYATIIAQNGGIDGLIKQLQTQAGDLAKQQGAN